MLDLREADQNLEDGRLRPKLDDHCENCMVQLDTLKTQTSLNKEVRPFFLSDNSIWSLPSLLPLAITAFGGPGGYFSLAIIAFGAFQFIVTKCYCRLGKIEFKESSLLI